MLSYKNVVETFHQHENRLSQSFYFPKISSTNEDCFKRGKLAGASGTLIVADTQTKGRGRLGRTWESPAGKGIYFSLLLRPKLPLANTPLLSLAAGLGAARALRQSGLPAVMVKWPNDLLIDRKKVGGMLSEMSQKGNELEFVVIGLGVNVSQEDADFSGELQGKASSLQLSTGKIWDRGEILKAIVPALLDQVDELIASGSESIIRRWEAESGMVGLEAKALHEGREIRGKVLGLGKSGQLRLQTDAGEVQLIAEDTTLL